ncbi:MAG: anhydro-N-acetylmuramic acid kinase [Limisphaerales bacterium]
MARYSKILGIMSGTSLDGVDCVLTTFDRRGRPAPARVWGMKFPSALRRRLMACASGSANSWECGQCHHDLGRFCARVAVRGLGGDRVDAVGLHGQTVFHRGGGPKPATWQIGEPAYLTESLRVPVVSNFRAADMAAGGQGAPLATLFHVRVFGVPGQHVCVQNLGGIGNVTSIDWTRGGVPEVRSFDTGPGNMLIDGAVRRLSRERLTVDRGGRWAAKGSVHEPLVARWLRDPYFHQPPPKSTGREQFGEAYLDRCWVAMDREGLNAADRVSTLTELTVRSVALNLRLHLPGLPARVVVCGGGVRNAELMCRLTVRLALEGVPAEVAACDTLGWPAEAVEGGAFALLARERLLGRPGNLPATTGARREVLCGQITAP